MTRELRKWALELAVYHCGDSEPVLIAQQFYDFVILEDLSDQKPKRVEWTESLSRRCVEMRDAGMPVKSVQDEIERLTGVRPGASNVRAQISLMRKVMRGAQQ